MRLPENTETRRKISRLKANQIENTGAEIVTTPCAVCYLGLKDTTEHYKQATPETRKVRMFFEVVYDAMMKGLERLGQTDRVRRPAIFETIGDTEAQEHSLAAWMLKLMDDPTFPALMEKLRKDPNVGNYARENPKFWGYFDQVAMEAAAQ